MRNCVNSCANALSILTDWFCARVRNIIRFQFSHCIFFFVAFALFGRSKALTCHFVWTFWILLWASFGAFLFLSSARRLIFKCPNSLDWSSNYLSIILFRNKKPRTDAENPLRKNHAAKKSMNEGKHKKPKTLRDKKSISWFNFERIFKFRRKTSTPILKVIQILI